MKNQKPVNKEMRSAIGWLFETLLIITLTFLLLLWVGNVITFNPFSWLAQLFKPGTP